jgi:4-hydroxyphenylpyruvate dioxygenase
VFAFSNALNPKQSELGDQLALKGDFVQDVAFAVQDAKAMYEKAVSRGAKSYKEPYTLTDEHGSVTIATVHTYGNVVHSFVERKGYSGAFLPGFKAVAQDPLSNVMKHGDAKFIDHCVGNMPDLQMETAADWYKNILGFHRFWSVDDKQVHTEYSALRSTVMADFDRTIRMPINEPAEGKKKSQIAEYVEYYGGAGVQHIALNVVDLVTTVSNLKKRGVDFLPIPASYYADLRVRLAASPTDVKESLDDIERLGILVDFDDQGYLLQLFTRPVQDRPTLFYEFIQRANHEGFGAGNFKALFESIERDQASRGNLT